MAKTRKILFFITPSNSDYSKNSFHIPQAFSAHGWQVHQASHNSVCFEGSVRLISGENLLDYDLIWPIGFGPQETFSDRAALLNLLPPRKLITSIHALQNLHAKSAWLAHGPRSYLSNDIEFLAQQIKTQPGPWVLKPNAGSYANNVHFLESEAELKKVLDPNNTQYWLLQRDITPPGQTNVSEIRVLTAGAQVVGVYNRTPGPSGMANLSVDGEASAAELSAAETTLVEILLQQFDDLDIGFASIDIANDLLIETNIANPGGLGTLQRVYGDNFYQDACQKLVRSAEQFIQK